MLSFAEENYLKAIFFLSDNGQQNVSTNDLSEALKTKPASASDMIRKLAAKKLLQHEKYHGVYITDLGKQEALKVVRKHRLWEVFLVEKLRFNWDEINDVAEQLEHIKSPLLVERLDEFLGFPKYDPHGDPIPDAAGEYNPKPKLPLSEVAVGARVLIVAVKDSSPLFLQYLDKIGVHIGASVLLLDRVAYDGSVQLRVNNNQELFISREAADNLMVTEGLD
jgi:DtxR family Mn-dependent transcriptional regulator